MSRFKILIVEDEPLIAENIAMYLNNNKFKVTGIAYDDEEALHQLQNNTPDAAILDINLESARNGINIASHINEHYNLPFLFLTSYADKDTLQQAKQVRPWGYIAKPFNENTLLASLEMAISNFSTSHNCATAALQLVKINKHLRSLLSQREFDVLQMIYIGKTNQQMAKELFVSVNTIKKHIQNSYLKLDTGSRSTAIARLRELTLK